MVYFVSINQAWGRRKPKHCHPSPRLFRETYSVDKTPADLAK
jgi:hypothetical protein